ncbi:hypothetical protein DBR12_20475 [Acidovorax sp. HMWF029]|nr:hypothetical protein DBR12_20475 [Acidovorax sp. HMWF029]
MGAAKRQVGAGYVALLRLYLLQQLRMHLVALLRGCTHPGLDGLIGALHGRLRGRGQHCAQALFTL